MRLILPLTVCAALPVFADDLPIPLLCTGSDPQWDMTVTENGTLFEYRDRTILDWDIALDTQAEGADWPRALTLIGRGTSAILMVEPAMCDTGAFSARVLTQFGETPVLLTGCCQSSGN